MQDLPLDDIERIEVIRGPGGALWGSNAVSGIINIIRKTAAESAGTSLSASGGSREQVALTARYGAGRPNVQYRVSGKYISRAAQATPGDLGYDDARLVQGGTRVDWTAGTGGFTLQGDIYRSVVGQRTALTTYTPPAATFQTSDDTLTGGNVLLRWTARAADPRSLQVKAYFDRTTRSQLTFSEVQHVADVDVQQGLLRGRNGLLWGAGYRLVDSQTETVGALRFLPADRADHLFTAFAQNEVSLIPDELALTLGAKFEHNDYSGAEWQPGMRLVWTVTDAHAVSLSVNRSVRTPSRVEHALEAGGLISAAGPVFVRLVPNPGFVSEELIAFEAGVVSLPHPKLLLTAAAFRNRHNRVLSVETGTSFVETDGGGSRTISPITLGNGLEGHSHGVEVTADLRVTERFRTTLTYSGLVTELSKRPGSKDTSREFLDEQGSPRHQLQLGASFSLPRRTSVDWFFRHVSKLPALDVPGYSTSNVTVHVPLTDGLTLRIVGRNLHEATHFEFSDGANGRIGIRREVFAGLRWSR